MIVEIDKQEYQVIFEQKHIKRTYLRITNDKKLLITSYQKLNKTDIHKLINSNLDWIRKQLSKFEIIDIPENKFLLFGKMYDVVIKQEDLKILDDVIITKNKDLIYEWAYKQLTNCFFESLGQFELPYTPLLTLRKMKSRWGVCHFKNRKVVLNKALIHLPYPLVEYVILHEISHFFHPNHSKDFYSLLGKHCSAHLDKKKSLKNYISLL